MTDTGTPAVREFPGGACLLAPALLRGRLVQPQWPTVAELRRLRSAGPGSVLGPTPAGTYLLARQAVDPADRTPTGLSVVVTPALDAGALVEPSAEQARAELLGLSGAEVAAFVDAVGRQLRIESAQARLDPAAGVWSTPGSRVDQAMLRHLAGLFDGAAMTRLVQFDLLGAATQLDRWEPVDTSAVPGRTARIAASEERLAPAPRRRPRRPQVRGIPTTQVHLTAGNTPVVLATSLLWGWASRGAVVVKAAHEVAYLLAILAPAIARAGADHPLARHTSLVYWPGGDPGIEPAMLHPDVTERVVAWGSGPALDSVVRNRAGGDVILMRPRRAISLVGRSALGAATGDTARRAAADSVVADQMACMASLLHLVQGSETQVDEYAERLLEVLGHWQAVLAHRAPAETAGRLVQWRRGALASADWRAVGGWPDIGAAVVRVTGRTDLTRHPGGRVVLVRAAPDLRAAARAEAGPAVSHVGVAPDALIPEVRDELVCRGVDNVFPLGEAERSYPGMPHDGVRMVHRLVRWVNA